MQVRDIDEALTATDLLLRNQLVRTRGLEEGVRAGEDLIDRCVVANIVIGFLGSIKDKAPWYLRLGIGMIIRRIADWKRQQGCME